MKKILLLLTTISFISLANSQCVTTAVPNQDTINCGDTVEVFLSGFADFALDNDFNLGNSGANWQATSSAQYDNPYIPSLTGDTYLWMGDQADVPRELTSVPLNLGFGGQICFDLAYAVQGDNTPVEGPDEPDEGVSLQYSIDGGATWIDIAYFIPNGTSTEPGGWGPGILVSNPGAASTEPGASGQTQFTQWATYCFPIPPGAQTGSTQIQWSQIFSSTEEFDHWGLDNVQVFLADPNYAFFDGQGNFVSQNPVEYVPTSDTTFNFIYTNAIDDTCFSSATVYLNPVDAGPDILVSCDGIGTQLNPSGVSPSANILWSPSAGLSDPNTLNPFVNPTADTEYTLTTACGTDDIMVLVEDSFSISINEVDTICANGSADINLTTSPSSVSIASVEWTNSGTLSDSIGNNVTASPFSTTQYVATVTSDSGCVIQDSVLVTVDGVGLPILVTPSNPKVCLGDSIDLTVGLDQDAISSYFISSISYTPKPTTGGTSINGLTDDNTIGPFPIGFNFDFYGNTFSQVYINSNGFITFDNITGGFLGNQTLPDPAAPNNIIAWGWDDLNFNSGGSASYYTAGTAPNRYVVFNFLNVPHFLNGPETVSVQVVLYENGAIEIHNIDVQADQFGASMTQGIENATGTDASAIDTLNNTGFSSFNQSFLYSPVTLPANPTYTWSPSAGLSSTSGSTVTATPLGDTEYTVTLIDGFCETTASVLIDIDSLLIDSITPDISLSCPESDIELFVDASTTTLLQPSDSIVQVGFETNTNTIETPYRGFWTGARIQMLYTAAELQAEGLVAGDDLTGLAFDVATVSSSLPYQSFTLSMLNTNLNTLTGFIPAGFTNVFGPASVSTTVGWNWYNFSTNFTWDGVSNIVVQACFENATFSSSDAVSYSTTLQNTVAYDESDFNPGCSLTSSSISNERPNIRFSKQFIPGGLAPISYQWSSNPVYTFSDDTINNPIILDEVNQVTEVYVDVTDGSCAITDTVLIDFSGSLVVSEDTTICEGDTVQLSAVGGSNPVWSPNDGSVSDTATFDPLVYPSSTTTYTVEVELTNCSVSGQVTVTVNEFDAPVLNNGATQVGTCLDEPITLTSDATPTINPVWTGPENGNGNSLTVNTSGVYTLTVSNDIGCSRSTDILVNIANPAQFNTDLVRNILCCNDSIVIDFQSIVDNNVPLDEVFWNGNINPISGETITLNNSQVGTYTFQAIDVNGCESELGQITITEACNEGQITTIDTVFTNQETVFTVDNSLENTIETWYPVNNFTNNVFTSDQEGVQQISVDLQNIFTLNNGEEYSCLETDTSVVYVLQITDPEMPNAFTPNGDGVNDIFSPVYLDDNSNITTFNVYNRWGEQVYSYDGGAGWDGKWNGEDQPVDVYNYYIVIDKITENFIISGSVSLFR